MADEVDWRGIAEGLAKALYVTCAQNAARDDEDDPVVSVALSAYEDATGATDEAMAAALHIDIVSVLTSRDLDGNVDETADAILEVFGLQR